CVVVSSCLHSLSAPPPPPIYTLSLHDALPISNRARCRPLRTGPLRRRSCFVPQGGDGIEPRGAARRVHAGDDSDAAAQHHADQRSEEHTSELQSHLNLVCRLLLEKKKKNTTHS